MIQAKQLEDDSVDVEENILTVVSNQRTIMELLISLSFIFFLNI